VGMWPVVYARILTSSLSLNSTRYSDSCSFTNHARSSFLTRGSKTSMTRQASVSKATLPIPYYIKRVKVPDSAPQNTRQFLGIMLRCTGKIGLDGDENREFSIPGVS